MRPLKIAHMSDLHYCEKHLRWVDEAFTQAVTAAISSHCDVAVLSGDSFDNTISVHHPAVDALISQVRRLSDHMPVLILQGTFSHDRPGAINVFRHIGGKFPVQVVDEAAQYALRDEDSHVKWTKVESTGIGNPRAIFSVLPSINLAELKAAGDEQGAPESVAAIMAKFSVGNLQARAAGIPTVLVSHGTVNGCVTESHNAMISPDHEFTTGILFGAETAATMLGHIHLHQAWEKNGRRIAYPGSITKLVYGHDAPTGFLLWDVAPDRADFVFHPLPARELLELKFDGPPDMTEIAAALPRARDAYVRVSYSIDEEHRHSVDPTGIREMFLSAGAAEVKVQPHINPVVRTRAAGIHQDVSIADKLRRWCDLSQSKPEPLLQRLALLEAGQEPGVRP